MATCTMTDTLEQEIAAGASSHENATFSDNLTEGENLFIQHMTRYGTDGYPVYRMGSRAAQRRKWQFQRAYGVGGTPVVYPTKELAIAAVDAYLDILRDKIAGRLEPSAGSPASFRKP